MSIKFGKIQVVSNFPSFDEYILDEEVSILAPLLRDKVLELINGPPKDDENRTVRKG